MWIYGTNSNSLFYSKYYLIWKITCCLSLLDTYEWTRIKNMNNILNWNSLNFLFAASKLDAAPHPHDGMKNEDRDLENDCFKNWIWSKIKGFGKKKYCVSKIKLIHVAIPSLFAFHSRPVWMQEPREDVHKNLYPKLFFFTLKTSHS